MAEIGLVPFACLALRVASAVLPRYRTRFSKQQFTQPQLLALLCLMRYEDWTFREVEVRVHEHRELRRALGCGPCPISPPCTAFCVACRKRFSAKPWPKSRGRSRARAAGRAWRSTAGLTHRALSTYYHRVIHPCPEKWPRWYWLKWLVAVDVDRQLLLAQMAYAGPGNASARFADTAGAGPTGRADGFGAGRCRVRFRNAITATFVDR